MVNFSVVPCKVDLGMNVFELPVFRVSVKDVLEVDVPSVMIKTLRRDWKVTGDWLGLDARELEAQLEWPPAS